MKVLEDSSFFGDGQWPPGFRFHPTDEELVLYYLKKKICRQRRKLDIIGEVDVYKWDPEELPGISRLKSGDRQWFFFSPRDRKYPNGGRANRATRHGYWKATGKDRTIASKSRSVGIKKTLVFYKGRAPTGVRTDWVMHEYTLHEEELKRCPTAQDYYALYKVYKKSGPGPKNGEQYGAPFREEDWADDENVIVEGIADQETSLKQANEFVLVDDTATNGQVHSQIDDLQAFMNQIANDSLFEPVSVAYDMQQVACGDEETHSTLVDQSLLQETVLERSMVILPSGQDNVQASFNPTQSATSHFQHNETSEVTSAPNMNRQGSRDFEEDLLEDFLEMDDLIGPEPTVQNMEKPVENLSFEGIDGLGELDLFQDVAMFLNDMGPIDPQPVSHTYFNKVNDIGTSVPSSCPSNLENGVVDPNSCPYFNSFETEVVQTISQTYHNNLDNEILSQFDYQLPYHSDEGNQLWMHNQNFNITIPAESNPGAVIPPTSGVIYAGENQNQFQNQNLNHNQSGKEDNVGDSWFSSALWTFVESIPTTPASASESTALMNKAFERLSSFGRISDKVKLSTLHTNANAGNPTATHRRSGNRFNRGLLIFSALGVLCAILWVLTGTSIMRVLGRCLS